MQLVDHNHQVLELTDTVATRKYPFTQEALDQIRDLREKREDEIYEETGKEVTVPAPIIIHEALQNLHNKEFN